MGIIKGGKMNVNDREKIYFPYASEFKQPGFK